LPYALTRAATAKAEVRDKRLIEQLPAPHHLLIVGGPTLFWTLDERMLIGTLRDMQEAAQERGSVLVTTSPRTPPSIHNAIERELAASNTPSLLAVPRIAPAYASLLEAADTIRVTADSVAMTSDAIWTGKPVALVPIRKSALWRMVIGTIGRIRPGQRLYPQDLRFFWRALAEIGVSDRPSLPRTSTSDEMRRVLARVEPILDMLGTSNRTAGAKPSPPSPR
jgi:hypothetical protein